MLKGTLLFAVGAVGLAMLAPSVFDGAPARPTTETDPAVATSPAEASSRGGDRLATGFRETSIEADPRGQFSADAIVDGMPVRMMIDTGASVVTISASTASPLGIVATSGPKWTVKTANGTTVASP